MNCKTCGEPAKAEGRQECPFIGCYVMLYTCENPDCEFYQSTFADSDNAIWMTDKEREARIADLTRRFGGNR